MVVTGHSLGGQYVGSLNAWPSSSHAKEINETKIEKHHLWSSKKPCLKGRSGTSPLFSFGSLATKIGQALL